MSTIETYRSLTTRDALENWHVGVLRLAAFFTRLKRDRQLTDGYKVVERRGMFHILYNGQDNYGPMSASVAYGWAQRLPLRHATDRADDVRAQVLV